jgi:predicted transcriptional regulator
MKFDQSNVDHITEYLGKYLYERRMELGVTQVELAKAIGVAQPHIARMEAEGVKTVDTLIKVATALDLAITFDPMGRQMPTGDSPIEPKIISDEPPEDIGEAMRKNNPGYEIKVEPVDES